MGDAAVNFRERDRGVAPRDPLREIVNVEAQFGLQVMRPGEEHLRRDAMKEVTEFQAEFVRGWRALGSGWLRGFLVVFGDARRRDLVSGVRHRG